MKSNMQEQLQLHVVCCTSFAYYIMIGFVYPATNNVDNKTKDNDAQPPIQTRRLSNVASQRARATNIIALFEYW